MAFDWDVLWYTHCWELTRDFFGIFVEIFLRVFGKEKMYEGRKHKKRTEKKKRKKESNFEKK